MNEPIKAKTPAQAIAEKGAGFAVGFDTQRIWATGVQAFVNGEHAMLVFREQILAQPDDGTASDFLIRNVASLVMPTAVLKEFHALIGPLLEGSNGEQG